MEDIPFLSEIMQSFANENFFGNFVQINLVLSILVMFYVAFFNIPYGKTYSKGKSFLKVEISDRIAFMISHSTGPIFFVLMKLYFPNGDFFSFQSFLFIGHYIHRTLIYPWFRKSHSKKWPIESLIFYTATNFVIGSTAARVQIFGGSKIPLWGELIITCLFICFAIGTAIHDYILCSLRSAGDRGYQIPQGLLFKWVSGPNYLLELLQWVSYAFFMPFNSGTAVFGLWLLVNISARAESNHQWYQNVFKTKYPVDRTAYLPFIKNSRWFL